MQFYDRKALCYSPILASREMGTLSGAQSGACPGKLVFYVARVVGLCMDNVRFCTALCSF